MTARSWDECLDTCQSCGGFPRRLKHRTLVTPTCTSIRFAGGDPVCIPSKHPFCETSRSRLGARVVFLPDLVRKRSILVSVAWLARHLVLAGSSTPPLFFSLYAEAAFSRKEIDQTLPAILFGGNEEANGLLTPKTDVFRGAP